MDSKLILEAARGMLDGSVRAGLATGSSASVAVCKDRRAWNIITWIAEVPVLPSRRAEDCPPCQIVQFCLPSSG
jgi:hypothetical protein